MLVYRWKEKSYSGGDDAADFANLTKKLYVKILEYEASLLVHMHHNAARRWARDVIEAGDWTGRIREIRKLDDQCSKLTEAMADHRAQKWSQEERRWQADLLMQPHKEQERRNIQKLYTNYEAVKNDYNPTRVPGTCQWFLRHPDFLAWRQSRSSGLLWVSADPGCGKSVLSKYLVDCKGDVLSLKATPPVVCYFFFKDGEPDAIDSSKALCAILHQLFLQRPLLYKYAEKDFDSKGDKFLSDFDALWNILIGAAMDESNDEIICVLDAVDECHEGSRKAFITKIASYYRYINENLGTQEGKIPVLKFLVTSRPYTQIEREFKQLTAMLPTIRLSGEDESASIRKEIDLVVDARVKDLGDKLDLSYSIQLSLRNRFLQIDQRTYLWLRLVIDSLESIVDVTEDSIEEMVETLPESVEKAYSALLNRSSDKAKARKLLNIVLASGRPLTLAEVNIAMAIQDKHHSKLHLEKGLWSTSSCSSIVKNLCGLFIIVVDSKVLFIHKTARDFLLSTRTEPSAEQSGLSSQWKGSFKTQVAHDILARVCISYLLLDDFARGPFVGTRFDPKYIQGYNLLNYASGHWATHVAMSDTADSALFKTIAFKLCNTDNLCFGTWYHVYQSLQRSSYPPPVKGTSLMVVSWFGLNAAAKLLTGGDVSVRDQYGRSALLIASLRGTAEVVESLLSEGADANAQDHAGRTPLSLAVEQGHQDIVTTLLKNKADVNTPDIVGSTSLTYAAKCGHETIAKQLLGSNPDINLKDDWGQTACDYARGHPRLAKLLQHIGSREVDNETSSGVIAKHESKEPSDLSTSSNKNSTTTPSAVPIQASTGISIVSSPEITDLVASMKAYIHECLQSKVWIASSDADMCVSARAPAASTGLGSFYDNMKFACDLYQRGIALEAGSHLFKSLSTIQTVVRSQSPNLLSHLIRVVAYLIDSKHLWIATTVCEQFSNAAMTMFQPDHPLRSIFARLPMLVQDKTGTEVIKASQGILDAFQDELGAMHMHSIYTRHILMEVKNMIYGPENVEQELLGLLKECEEQLGPNSAQSVQILVDLAQSQLNCGLVARAEKNGQNVVEKAKKLLQSSRIGKAYHMLCEGHRIAADAQTAQGKQQAAEANLREAFQTAQRVWKENNSATLKYRQGLVNWLLVHGRTKDATDLYCTA